MGKCKLRTIKGKSPHKPCQHLQYLNLITQSVYHSPVYPSFKQAEGTTEDDLEVLHYYINNREAKRQLELEWNGIGVHRPSEVA